MKDRWNKQENLSDCPHCLMTSIDNANYTRHHGDNCWLKDKVLVGYSDDGKEIIFTSILSIEDYGCSINVIKNKIKKGGKHKKLFWKLRNRA